MKPKIVVYVFPGTNSEDETKRALDAVGLDARLVPSSDTSAAVRGADGYVLSGGFAYEDRVRAGAIAAHDPAMDVIIDAAQRKKLVLGICNGAQMLAEAGLVPGTGAIRRPTAAFAPNAHGGRFRCVHTYMRLAVPPSRSPIVAALGEGAVIPAWAAHAEGRLAAAAPELERIVQGGHLAFVYSTREGEIRNDVVPNGSALGAAGLVNEVGNVLAVMPHPERDAWTFMHREEAARPRSAQEALRPSGGITLFESFAKAFA
ncbi:MAG: phosphoribosylformylglycinamidine synthase subunit PurQ [Vulcanimicrobiaceae bacterium]